MRMIVGPNRWTCLPAAFAMILGLDLEDIFKIIGHDGSEIVFPELPEPICRRGFHVQEMIDVAWFHGKAVVGIELGSDSCRMYNGHVYKLPPYMNDCQRFEQYVRNCPGVLGGINLGTGNPHAVAWDTHKIYDPADMIYDFKNRFFKPTDLYCVFDINNDSQF